MTIRVRFGKEGSLRYIGHLDLLRTFQKIFRRAGIPMCYSQGFSPHPVMSFALPLGLGLTSEGEYLDADIEEGMGPEEVMERLRKATSDELPVYAVILLPEKAGNAMASVGRAVYRFTFGEMNNEEREAVRQALEAFLEAPKVPALKKTKTREIEEDIRPMVFGAGLEEDGLILDLAAGSAANLKPEMLVETLKDRFGFPTGLKPDGLRRLDLMRADGRSLGKAEGGGA